MKGPRLFVITAALALTAVVAMVAAPRSVSPPANAHRVVHTPPSASTPDSRSVASRSREWIGYYHSIALTPEQEAIKSEVLGSMPAPCCSGSSALTCCCPCNLSKTIWGLSNYALAEQHVDAEGLRRVVSEWLETTNPDGVGRGSGCYRGACGAPFDRGGCGGMNEDALTL